MSTDTRGPVPPGTRARAMERFNVGEKVPLVISPILVAAPCSDEAAASVALAHAAVASERAHATAKQGPLVQELARAMADRAVEMEGVA